MHGHAVVRRTRLVLVAQPKVDRRAVGAERMPVFGVVVHADAVGVLQTLNVVRIEVQQVRLLVMLGFPPFRQIGDTGDIRRYHGVVEVEEVFFADRVGDLPGTVRIMCGFFEDFPIMFDELVEREPLLDIAFDEALPQQEITRFKRVDAPPLHRTVLHDRQPVQQDFRLCNSRAARTGPVRLGVRDTGERAGQRFRPCRVNRGGIARPQA